MSTLTDKLRSNIGKIKSATASSPVPFALVTGPGGGALLLGGDSSNTTLIGEAKTETRGSTIIKGSCFFEEGAAIFQSAPIPGATQVAAIEKCLKAAGASLKIQARLPGAHAEQHESESDEHATPAGGKSTTPTTGNPQVKTRQPDKEAEQHEAESEEKPGTPSAKSAKPDPRIAKIDAQVKDLNARLAKADPKASSAQGAKLKLSEAAMNYRKGNLDQTEKLLKEADSLLTHLASKK